MLWTAPPRHESAIEVGAVRTRKFCCIHPDTPRRCLNGPTLRWPKFRQPLPQQYDERDPPPGYAAE